MPCVLQELIIFQLESGPRVDDLMALLDTFAGQPLKKFLMTHLFLFIILILVYCLLGLCPVRH